VVLMTTVCVHACPRRNEWGGCEVDGSPRRRERAGVEGGTQLEIVCGRIVVSSRGRERDGNMGRRGETPTTETRERYWPWRRREDEKKERGLDVIHIHAA
jgi:hypothetical protein